MNQRYCNGMIHVIKQGDNLYQLSRKYRVPLALILRANPYVDVYNLQPGQEICIPVARPYPGMMPPPFGMRPPHRKEAPMSPEPDEMEMPEAPMEVQEKETDLSGEEEDDIDDDIDDDADDKDDDDCIDKIEFVSDGEMSVGDILRKNGMSVSDFFECNSPDGLVLAKGTRIYLPKNV